MHVEGEPDLWTLQGYPPLMLFTHHTYGVRTLNHAHVVKQLGLCTFVSIEKKEGGMSCTAYVLLKLCPEME